MPSIRPFHWKTALVRNLRALPTEILFKILDDLPVYAILRVACSGDERINECILQHGKYSALFSSGGTFEELKRYFKLYDEVYTGAQLPKLEEESILALDISMYSSGHRSSDTVSGPRSAPVSRTLDSSCIKTYLHSRIWQVLQMAEKHLDVLNNFINNPKNKLRRVWDFSTIDNLESRWRTICDAEIALNTVKSRQITRLADLLEMYPDLLLSSTDMVQEFCGSGHPNAHHMASRYRVMAKKILLPQVFAQRPLGLRGACLFASNTLPVIPTWQSLRVFLAGLEQYSCAMAEEFRRDVNSEGAKEKRHHHSYPHNIEEDIRTTLMGIAYVYINPSSPAIPPGSPVTFRRTENTPYSVPSETCDCNPTPGRPNKRKGSSSVKPVAGRQTREGQKNEMIEAVNRQPHFCIPAQVAKEPMDGYEGLLNTGLPHDERELAWLEAYLRVVRYMSGKLGVEA